ncbi:hypothetical protein PT2222_20213 [Paraburkholderia tropica]
MLRYEIRRDEPAETGQDFALELAFDLRGHERLRAAVFHHAADGDRAAIRRGPLVADRDERGFGGRLHFIHALIGIFLGYGRAACERQRSGDQRECHEPVLLHRFSLTLPTRFIVSRFIRHAWPTPILSQRRVNSSYRCGEIRIARRSGTVRASFERGGARPSTN